MKINVKELSASGLDNSSTVLVLLPVQYLSNTPHTYSSTTISFYKYSQHKIPIEFLTIPERLIEQRSSEWFGPIIYITSLALAETPDLVNLTIEMIKNYLSDFFKGMDSPVIKLTFVHNKTANSTTTEISYEGDIKGLTELNKTLNKVIENNEH